jgi:MFS family permease
LARRQLPTIHSVRQTLGETTFAALSVRNYRLFVMGQAVSLSGTWMQTVAQGLLVLQLTGSGTALGIVTALQTLPVLLFGAWGGLIADRYPKRQILYVVMAVSGLASLLMGALTVAGTIELWMIYVIATILGLIKVFENPTRQTFVREMVGNDLLRNAVSLNQTEMNLARVIGPLIAGVMVATVGLGVCFIANGLSFGVVIATLALMRARELHPSKPVPRAKGQLQEGFRYVAATPVLRDILLMMAIIGTFTYEFTVILPLFAEFTLGNGETGYAMLTAGMGIGAVVGGLYTASRKARDPKTLVRSAALFGGSMFLLAAAPNLALAIGAMIVVGFFSVNFTSLASVTLQLSARSTMQGRVMALWSIAFLGTTPIGGPIIGAIGEHAGPRWGVLVGGVAALVAAALGLLTARRAAAQASGASSPTAMEGQAAE